MAYGMDDRVREQVSFAGGTGVVTLTTTPVSGFQSFLSGWGASGTGEYCHVIGAQWETGFGTLNAGGTTLTRTTVYDGSSGAGVAVNFSAGTMDCFGDLPAELAHYLNMAEITVASAATCDIGAVRGSSIEISGTTTITAFGTSKNRRRFVRFSGVLTLTHNATTLILPGAANITTAAGDTAIFASNASGNWRCISYQSAADIFNSRETTVASATTTDIGSAASMRIEVSGTTTITGFGAAVNKVRIVRFSGALTLTHNATSLILPKGGNILTVAGDCAILQSDGSGNWRCVSFQRKGQTFAQGSFTRDLTTASGTQAVTGIGFKPDLIFFWGGVNATPQMFFGAYATANSGFYNNHSASANTWGIASFIGVFEQGSSATQILTMSSLDVDGFTMSWTKGGSPTGTGTVFYMAMRL